MTTMKILIFNWRDITHPWSGGAEVYIHEIGKRLAKKGHEVTLFCRQYPGCEKESIIDGINIIRKGGEYSVYLYAPIIYLSRLRKRYDIIIDCENGIPFFTPLFADEKKICIVHHIHKDIFNIEKPFYIAWIGNFLEEYLMPLIYRRTEFIAISPSTKKEMVNIGIDKEKIKTIFNGMNGQFYPDFNKKKDNTIIYVGRIKRYKQLDHLVKAFRIVKNRIPNSKLIIAGRGDISEIEELSRKLDLDVKLYNDITEDEKLDLLQKARIFATTSIKEGWGITVIEANRCGTPVVAYDVPGLRDSVRNNETGLLTKLGDIEGIADNIIKMIEDDNFREQLNKNALDWSQNFDWNRATEEMLGTLENIMRK